MNSIKARFDSFSQKNPYLSSFVCFTRAVRERGYSKPSIREWFNKLVEKDDYCTIGKRNALNYFYEVSESKNPKMHHDKNRLKSSNLKVFSKSE